MPNPSVDIPTETALCASRLGDRLKSLRDERGLTTDELADAAQVSTSTMQAILSGDIERPPNARLSALAKLLGVSLDELLRLAPADRREPEKVTQGAFNRCERVALNTELSPVDGGAPPSVEMIPPGPRVQGRDGRAWTFDAEGQRQVLAAFAARGADLPIDWEHATQHRAPQGLKAPAAGWITALNVHDGALVADVQWTPRGNSEVADRSYRYISPVFDYEPGSGRIVRLVSAGLTNLANLRLPALNSEEDPVMTRSAALAAAITGALGLTAEATDDAVAQAINTLKSDRDTAQAANREQTPSLDRYVPRADYDALAQRATNAEQALQAQQDAQHKAAADAAIEQALTAGKITPATVEYHRATCADAAGLERFLAFVAAAPTIAADTGLAGKKQDSTSTALNAEELAVCHATGISPEAFAKARAAA